MILKLGGKIKILGAKIILWVDHLWTRLLLVQTCNNVTIWLDSSRNKNARAYATDTTNRFSNTTNEFTRAKWKIARTGGPGSRTIIFRFIIEQNLISRMIEIPVYRLIRKSIRIKSVGNTRNRMLQTHFQAILIRPTTVTRDASDVKIRATKNGSDKIMRTFNGKVADYLI